MCGIIGLYYSDSSHSVSQGLVDALTVLQHRGTYENIMTWSLFSPNQVKTTTGQDAAGIVTIMNGHLNLIKDNGTVADVFTQANVVSLQGNNNFWLMNFHFNLTLQRHFPRKRRNWPCSIPNSWRELFCRGATLLHKRSIWNRSCSQRKFDEYSGAPQISCRLSLCNLFFRYWSLSDDGRMIFTSLLLFKT